LTVWRPLLRRRWRGRRVALAVFALVIGLAAIALLTVGSGTYETFPRTGLLTPAQRYEAPAWTKPCWRDALYRDDTTCAHVNGRVVWIQRRDSDGDGDRHLVLMVHLHPRIVKISRDLPVSRLPRIGTRIEVAGYLLVGGSGRPEIEARTFRPGGPTGD
jgi:hypothetical protein